MKYNGSRGSAKGVFGVHARSASAKNVTLKNNVVDPTAR
jgi:hypothetical protein